VGHHQAQEGRRSTPDGASPFAKLIKNIEVAARTGGGDVNGNPTLYDAIQKAKKTSVPERQHRAGGQARLGHRGGGADYQTIMYEGYGPERRRGARRVPDRQPQPGCAEVRTAMTRNGWLAWPTRARCPTCSTARAS
jgi:hypothetical protein